MTIHNTFDQIKKINEYGQEFWSARDLMPLLGYEKWDRFENVLNKAQTASKNTGNMIEEHFFPEVGKSTGGRPRSDCKLSRYACYLIAQNGDSRKKEIALAQTYFAVQTRKQEIQESLLEDKKRVLLRDDMKKHNKKLAEAASNAGVKTQA